MREALLPDFYAQKGPINCLRLHDKQVRKAIEYQTSLTLNYMASHLYIKPLSPQAQTKRKIFSNNCYINIKTSSPPSSVCSIKYTAADYLPERSIKFYKFCITDRLMVFLKNAAMAFVKNAFLCKSTIMFYSPTHKCIPINFDSLFFNKQYLFKTSLIWFFKEQAMCWIGDWKLPFLMKIGHAILDCHWRQVQMLGVKVIPETHLLQQW